MGGGGGGKGAGGADTINRSPAPETNAASSSTSTAATDGGTRSTARDAAGGKRSEAQACITRPMRRRAGGLAMAFCSSKAVTDSCSWTVPCSSSTSSASRSCFACGSAVPAVLSRSRYGLSERRVDSRSRVREDERLVSVRAVSTGCCSSSCWLAGASTALGAATGCDALMWTPASAPKPSSSSSSTSSSPMDGRPGFPDDVPAGGGQEGGDRNFMPSGMASAPSAQTGPSRLPWGGSRGPAPNCILGVVFEECRSRGREGGEAGDQRRPCAAIACTAVRRLRPPQSASRHAARAGVNATPGVFALVGPGLGCASAPLGCASAPLGCASAPLGCDSAPLGSASRATTIVERKLLDRDAWRWPCLYKECVTVKENPEPIMQYQQSGICTVGTNQTTGAKSTPAHLSSMTAPARRSAATPKHFAQVVSLLLLVARLEFLLLGQRGLSIVDE